MFTSLKQKDQTSQSIHLPSLNLIGWAVVEKTTEQHIYAFVSWTSGILNIKKRGLRGLDYEVNSTYQGVEKNMPFILLLLWIRVSLADSQHEVGPLNYIPRIEEWFKAFKDPSLILPFIFVKLLKHKISQLLTV